VFESLYSQEFLLLHIVQADSGVHPICYPMGTGSLSSGVKQPGREVDHSPSNISEAKKMWILLSTPPYVFKA
jgi:hypothetical protein